MSQKQCSQCKEWKDLTEFFKESAKKDGLRSNCRQCQNKRNRQHYQENRESEIEKVKRYRAQRPEWVRAYNESHYRNNHEYHLERGKKYREENRESRKTKARQNYKENREKEIAKVRNYQERNKDKIKLYRKRYEETHKEQVKDLKKAWDARNADKAIQYTNKRRFHLQANGGDYTLEEWQTLCEEYDNKCLCCGIHAKDTPKGKLSPDHIIPLSKGGSNDISNIQPLCLSCNISKHDNVIDYRL